MTLLTAELNIGKRNSLHFVQKGTIPSLIPQLKDSFKINLFPHFEQYSIIKLYAQNKMCS